MWSMGLIWSISERKSKQKADFFTGFDTFALLHKLLIRANLIFYSQRSVVLNKVAFQSF
jgi:hypothetical protein